MGWLGRAWRGEERLWRVFWIYGVLFGIILNVINHIAGMFLGASVAVPYLVIGVIHSIWLVVALWRCAFNAEWRIWGYVIRILNVMCLVFLILGFLMGLSLVGADLIKAAECRKELKAYVEKGGNDPEGFQKECRERHTHPDKASTSGAVTRTPPVSTNAVPIELKKYKKVCEQIMTEHAQKGGADPQPYIAQNQAYLHQCIQYYQGKDASSSRN